VDFAATGCGTEKASWMSPFVMRFGLKGKVTEMEAER